MFHRYFRRSGICLQTNAGKATQDAIDIRGSPLGVTEHLLERLWANTQYTTPCLERISVHQIMVHVHWEGELVCSLRIPLKHGSI